MEIQAVIDKTVELTEKAIEHQRGTCVSEMDNKILKLDSKIMGDMNEMDRKFMDLSQKMNIKMLVLIFLTLVLGGLKAIELYAKFKGLF